MVVTGVATAATAGAMAAVVSGAMEETGIAAGMATLEAGMPARDALVTGNG